MPYLPVFRYNAIVNPLKARVAHTFKRTLIVIVVIWVLAAAVAIPFIVVQYVFRGGDIIYCLDNWTRLSNNVHSKTIYVVITFIINFVIPISIIAGAYSTIIKRLTTTDSILSETIQLNQERSSSVGCKSPADEKLVEKSKSISRNTRKTTFMMLTVIVAFLVCMLPLNVFNLVYLFLVPGSYDETALSNVHSALVILSVCASACNPIIYNFFSVKFRKAFVDVFRCRCTTQGQDEGNDTFPVQSSFRTKRTSIL